MPDVSKTEFLVGIDLEAGGQKGLLRITSPTATTLPKLKATIKMAIDDAAKGGVYAPFRVANILTGRYGLPAETVQPDFVVSDAE